MLPFSSEVIFNALIFHLFKAQKELNHFIVDIDNDLDLDLDQVFCFGIERTLKSLLNEEYHSNFF